MTSLSVAAVLLALLAGWLWIALIVSFPRNRVSLLRYKLWRIRDRLVDDIHGGAVPPTVGWIYVTFIEEMIHHAHTATMFNLVVSRVLTPRVIVEEHRALAAFLDPTAKLSGDDPLYAYRRETMGEIGWHVLFGAPSGWIASVLLVPCALAYVALRGLVRCCLPGSGVENCSEGVTRADGVGAAASKRSHRRQLGRFVVRRVVGPATIAAGIMACADSQPIPRPQSTPSARRLAEMF